MYTFHLICIHPSLQIAKKSSFDGHLFTFSSVYELFNVVSPFLLLVYSNSMSLFSNIINRPGTPQFDLLIEIKPGRWQSHWFIGMGHFMLGIPIGWLFRMNKLIGYPKGPTIFSVWKIRRMDRKGVQCLCLLNWSGCINL